MMPQQSRRMQGQRRKRNRNNSNGPDVDGDAGHDDDVSAKRRRIALACNACRARKSRCNGARPRCALCDGMGFECVYESSGSSTNIIVQKEYVVGLADQVKQLEDRVAEHSRIFAANATVLALPDGSSSSLQNGDGHGHGRGHASSISLRNTELQELPPEELLTDGMAVSLLAEEDSGFFGPSSNISLIGHVARAMACAGGPQELNSPMPSGRFDALDSGIISASRALSPTGVSHEQTAPESEASMYTLPSDAETRHLLRGYFSNTGLLFPYIHEPSFFEMYDTMQAVNFTKVRRTSLGLLNMVLALSSNTTVNQTKPAVRRMDESDLFYRRAMGLCHRQILRGTSLEIVQYLLLMGQYLQGTQKSVQAWTIHGLAVKAALSLGLHSSEAAKKFGPLEQEVRKRTWFGCVILDRSLSVTFGRPPAIPEDYIRLPLPESLISDEEPTLKQELDLMSVNFFNSTITLYRIMSKVVASLYGQNLGCDDPLEDTDLLTKIVQFEHELDDWQRRLPPGLELKDPATLELDADLSGFERFRVILSLRRLNLDVLLHRPVLVRSIDCQSRSTGGLPPPSAPRSIDNMRANSIQTCIGASETIITMVYSVVTAEQPAKHLLGAWWFSLYYLFNAALVVFGGLLIPTQHYAVNSNLEDRIQRCQFYLSGAQEALQKLDDGNATVHRCANYLVQVYQSINTWRRNANAVPSSQGENVAARSNGQHAHSEATVADIPPAFFGNFQDASPLDDDDDAMYSELNGLELGQFFMPQ